MARYDDLNTGTLGYLTFMSVILLAITVLLLQALTYNWIDWQEDSKLTKQSYTTSDNILQAQRDSLTKYDRVQVELPPPPPPADGSAAPAAPAEPVKVPRWYIPLEKAEAMVIEEVKNKGAKPAPST